MFGSSFHVEAIGGFPGGDFKTLEPEKTGFRTVWWGWIDINIYIYIYMMQNNWSKRASTTRQWTEPYIEWFFIRAADGTETISKTSFRGYHLEKLYRFRTSMSIHSAPWTSMKVTKKGRPSHPPWVWDGLGILDLLWDMDWSGSSAQNAASLCVLEVFWY